MCILVFTRSNKMNLEMIVANSGEMWVMVFFLLIGGGFLIFGRKAELILAGVVALAGITLVAYSNHSNYMEKQFTLKRFNEGKALVCGLWRGENVRVDFTKGWIREEEIGFVKGDVIINDIGVCSVIGESSPEPSSIPYWIVFVSMVGVLSMLRSAIMTNLEKVVEKEDHDDADNDTNRKSS